MMRVSVIEELSTYTARDEDRYESVVSMGLADYSDRSLRALRVPEREMRFRSPDLDGQDGIDERAFTDEGREALLSNSPGDDDNLSEV